MASGLLHSQYLHGVHSVKSVYAANKPLWVHVIDGDYALWVDVGIDRTPAEVVMPYLVKHAPALWARPQVALITHADVDHFGGLRWIRQRRADFLVLAHGADKAWIESPARVMRERYEMHLADGFALTAERQAALNERGGGGGKVDVSLRGGEALDLGPGGIWRVLHTPGHSAGHLTLWCAERRCAIIGDAALDWGVPDDTGKLTAPPPYYDVDAYLGAPDTLERLGAETMFTSHYGILDWEQAARLIRNSRDAVGRLESAVLAALREHPTGLTLAEMCTQAGERAGHWEKSLWPALNDPISAHLARAMAAGHVRVSDERGRRSYRWLPDAG